MAAVIRGVAATAAAVGIRHVEPRRPQLRGSSRRLTPPEKVVISMRADFASPSSFLTTYHGQPGEERDALSTEDSHRDTTPYQVATLDFKPPEASARATGQPPRK